MSLSKEATPAAEQPRQQPKCGRCRHHGVIVPLKGHVKYCPFSKCECWKCFRITERTRTKTLQRNVEKELNDEQRPGVDEPAAGGTRGALSPADGGARRDGALERTATTSWSPNGPRRGPAAGGDMVAGLGSGDLRPVASSDEGSYSPFHAPHSGEFVQGPPLPVIQYQLRLSGHHPNIHMLCPTLLINMPWFPPVPAALYSDGLCGPLMFPNFQSGAVHRPPPPEPGPLAPPPLPEPFQEELMSRQHPPSTHRLIRHTEELD